MWKYRRKEPPTKTPMKNFDPICHLTHMKELQDKEDRGFIPALLRIGRDGAWECEGG